MHRSSRGGGCAHRPALAVSLATSRASNDEPPAPAAGDPARGVRRERGGRLARRRRLGRLLRVPRREHEARAAQQVRRPEDAWPGGAAHRGHGVARGRRRARARGAARAAARKSLADDAARARDLRALCRRLEPAPASGAKSPARRDLSKTLEKIASGAAYPFSDRGRRRSSSGDSDARGRQSLPGGAPRTAASPWPDVISLVEEGPKSRRRRSADLSPEARARRRSHDQRPPGD